ncbi:MAG: acyl-CoA synthetase, partial [Burkholderiales bacterium]
LGQIFFQFYGQSEAPLAITVLRKAEHLVDDPLRLASCGKPHPYVHCTLLDDDCNPVPDGEPGEICVRGPQVMAGYLDKPAETAEAFKGGWLHTGDIAVRNPDGYLRIVDRKKDMIVSGGFNVFAREVENVISKHAAVAQVAVIGVPDPKWGEAVTAVVVKALGADVEPEVLIAMVREEKGPVQAPKTVHFVESIPVSAVGKPDKKALREQFSR